MRCTTYLVVFDSPQNAYVFVKKVHIAFEGDIATFRDGDSVLVFDATINGARQRIYELARSSKALGLTLRKSRR